MLRKVYFMGHLTLKIKPKSRRRINMKRQLIAALLAFNVAAVAVPSATFTVNAAEDTGIEAQTLSEDIDTAKQSTMTAIRALVTETDYYANQLKAAKDAVTKYVLQADKVSGTDIDQVKDSLEDILDAATTEIATYAKKTAVDAAKGVVNTKFATVTNSTYTDQKVTEATNLKNAALDAIEKASTTDLANGIAKEYENKVNGYEKLSACRKGWIDKAKAWFPEGVKDADDYGLYLDHNNNEQNSKTAYNSLISAFESAINAETDEDAMKVLFTEYQDDLKEIPTRAQGEAEAKMVAVRTAAKADLEKYLPKTEAAYTGNQLLSVKLIKDEGNTAIDAAKTEDEVKKAVADAKAKIDAVKTKADVEKSAADVVAEIKKLGEIDIKNYESKYAALVAAEDSYEAVENGPAGQQAIDKETATKNGTSTMLKDARIAYETHKKTELTAELDKVDKAITDLSRSNYLTSGVKAQLDSVVAAAKTIKNDTTIATRLGNGTTAGTIKNYNDKITSIATAIATELNGLFTKLGDVTDSKFVIDNTNKKIAELTVATYDELAALDADNSALSTHRKAYRKLKSLFAVEQDKEADKDLANAEITAIPDQIYTGKAIEITNVEVKDKAGNVIDSANYEVSYVNHTNKGTATIKVTAKGDTYKGSKTATFNIVARDIKDAKVTVENLYYRSGKARNASPVVKVDGVDIARNRDYTVTYKNNINVGLATVEIAGVGNYTGNTKATYAIMPEKAKITSLKAGSKKFTVKIVKEKGAKYQVAYKVKGTSKYKTVTTSSVSKTVKGLKKGKTYSVKVRAYQTINGKKYLGNYSNVKTVKVK